MSLLLFAEDSTTFPNMTKPAWEGGIGFDFKWNMGWMNDTLRYFEKDPVYRKYHHDLITFGTGLRLLANNSFCLCRTTRWFTAKRSLVNKMPGDYWQKFANFRTLIGLQFTSSRKETALHGRRIRSDARMERQRRTRLVLARVSVARTRQPVRPRCDFGLYTPPRSSYELDHDPAGFAWIDQTNREQSIYSFARFGSNRLDCCRRRYEHDAGRLRSNTASACRMRASTKKFSTATKTSTADRTNSTEHPSPPMPIAMHGFATIHF
ncbi:MAG: hypothetical protein MZU97_19340 [Bacillus subtilis]|nr:hypothetical protein [Bacillus subtilis]